jgi:hypothetical protein
MMRFSTSTAAILVASCLPALAQLPTSYLSPERLGVQDCIHAPNTDRALYCWLSFHPNITSEMKVDNPGAMSLQSWPDWPVKYREDMVNYFDQMVLWYHNGMPTASAPRFYPDQLPTIGTFPFVSGGWGPAMSLENGLAVYFAMVANTLAVELTAKYTWSIVNYTPAELDVLLDQNTYWIYLTPPTSPDAGYNWQATNEQSPANPSTVALFFKNNGIVGATQTITIQNLFAWERILRHDFYIGTYPGDQQFYTNLWGPGTPPIPDIELIRGDNYTGEDGPQFGHFTNGCTGTMSFMQSILRTVNIPEIQTWVSCTHATPMFPTANLAMSHGDDPYDSLGFVTAYPGYPAPTTADYLLTIPQYNQIFTANQTYPACVANVGIQVANVAIKYLSDYLMNLYCEDLNANATPAAGQVLAVLSNYDFSLTQLENMGLWTGLAAKQSALNWCSTLYTQPDE